MGIETIRLRYYKDDNANERRWVPESWTDFKHVCTVLNNLGLTDRSSASLSETEFEKVKQDAVQYGYKLEKIEKEFESFKVTS